MINKYLYGRSSRRWSGRTRQESFAKASVRSVLLLLLTRLFRWYGTSRGHKYHVIGSSRLLCCRCCCWWLWLYSLNRAVCRRDVEFRLVQVCQRFNTLEGSRATGATVQHRMMILIQIRMKMIVIVIILIMIMMMVNDEFAVHATRRWLECRRRRWIVV